MIDPIILLGTICRFATDANGGAKSTIEHPEVDMPGALKMAALAFQKASVRITIEVMEDQP